MTRKKRLLAFAASLVLLPCEASAHLVSTGLGPVYDGVWHFVQEPAQLLSLAALALFAGLRGPVHARRSFFLLPPAWLIGFFLPLALPPTLTVLLPPLTLLIVGGLLASDLRVPPAGIAALAILMGSVLGFSYAASAEGPAVPYTTGALVCIIVLLALLCSISLPLKGMPGRIAVRVAGSWTSALGLLLAGWWIHGGG